MPLHILNSMPLIWRWMPSTVFGNMPIEYYGDWLKVAAEEAYHFSLLRDYLQQHGHDYGDFPAHQSLWEMAQRTAHDVMVRMALVPRVMEARGLDVTPGLIKKLQHAKDNELVARLEIIHRDEIGHVAIGSNGFAIFASNANWHARSTFRQLVDEYMKGSLKGPLMMWCGCRRGLVKRSWRI